MVQPGLVWSRAVVKRDYAILPPEGVAISVLPEWKNTVSRVLTAPAMGAKFVEYLLELAAGGGTDQTLRADVQGFLYVLEGDAALTLNGASHTLRAGGYAYMKPGSKFALAAKNAARVLWLKKVYAPFGTARPGDRA
jgi:(S)-ureidoglycine aminohydrolase